MKVVVLHGQNHKGNTWHITRLLLDEICEKTDVITEFQTNDTEPCIGCFSCILKSEELCPHRSVLGPVIEAIEQADIVIADSPNYCMGMSGQMKMFFDHMSYRWMSHRPHCSMKQKIGVAISTTAGMGAKKTAKDIARQMFWWGMAKTYNLSYVVAASSWTEVNGKKKQKILMHIQKQARRIKKSIGTAKPGITTKFIFSMMRAQQKGMAWNLVDRQHWEDNGWI